MARKPLGHCQLRASDWGRPKRFERQKVNAGQRRDGKYGVKSLLQGDWVRATRYMPI